MAAVLGAVGGSSLAASVAQAQWKQQAFKTNPPQYMVVAESAPLKKETMQTEIVRRSGTPPSRTSRRFPGNGREADTSGTMDRFAGATIRSRQVTVAG